MEEIYFRKKELRKSILDIRNNLDSDTKKENDNIIRKKFLESSYYKNAEKIFIYISYSSEINTIEIINRALNDGKEIFVPRTVFKTKAMDAVKITSLEKLKKDRYGIPEPEEDASHINPDKLDLIVVPGVAFDNRGGRIGYGAGYYDRYFKKISKERSKIIKKIALAYNFQVIENVPMDEQDVKIDCIITEKHILK
ncbi:5-formyltetrahydrofolate cyclo-ligase [uncultured Clostridium sp.]|uniref:5-formyltetrahydrofolate cyclo-ligase n=1 Tax=uncultured Clostridium sp. TaxID=59620 RepID=UPI0025F57C0B|nr:5-formyltetrahydrofolate cyclo-ligase [uncultured Clostridium sp.]